jgi:uncharacterized protein (DUF433 family)
VENLLDRITVDPDVLVGKPVIKGTRVPVYIIVELVANGMTAKEILKEYPRLKAEDVKAALLYASKLVESEVTRLLSERGRLRHLEADNNCG